MNLIKFYLLLTFALIVNSVQGQTTDDEIKPCGTSSIPFPPEDSVEIEFNGSIAKEMLMTKTIPVVFHIFHRSGSENVSKEDVWTALERLNSDFANLNSNLSSTPEVFKNISVDIEVEFKLASIDPNGNCTDGINRVYTDSTDFFNAYYPNPHWPKEKYLNIYILGSIWDVGSDGFPSGSSGYGYYPASINPRDGIYLSYRTILFSPQNVETLSGQGATMTHEVGHWLNLRHIWGDDGTACTGSDLVSDTPNQAGPSNTVGSSPFAPFEECFSNFPLISCNNEPNGNMFCNYMDYSGCRTMFTEGQKVRMQNTLNGSVRFPVWQQDNLTATGVNSGGPNFSCPSAPKADFACDQRYIIKCEPNIFVSFKERSFQAIPNSFQWFFPGGIPSTSTNPEVIVNYPSPGNYEVILIAQNSYGSDTVTRIINVQVVPSAAYPISSDGENFESANTITDVGSIYETLGNINFELCTTTGFNSNKSIKCPKAIFYGFTFPRFVTQKFNIGEQDSVLNFKIAYSNGASKTLLSVNARTNCLSDSSGLVLGTLYSQDLISSTFGSPNEDFYPVSDDEWKDVQFVIPQKFRGRDDVQFTFTFRGYDANNFFIDNIKIITTPLSSVQNLEQLSKWEIFPNPTSNYFSLHFADNISVRGQLIVSDLLGRIVFKHEVSEVASGASGS